MYVNRFSLFVLEDIRLSDYSEIRVQIKFMLCYVIMEKWNEPQQYRITCPYIGLRSFLSTALRIPTAHNFTCD